MAQFIRYAVEDRVATITLDRADRANAQNEPFLHQLNEAWEKAAEDESVRVILLRAEGKHFSAGHDVSPEAIRDGSFNRIRETIAERGLLGIHEWEAKHYLGYSKRWRDIPKPSIAAVQGACIAGGLMLCWPCDLIVAAKGTRLGIPEVKRGLVALIAPESRQPQLALARKERGAHRLADEFAVDSKAPRRVYGCHTLTLHWPAPAAIKVTDTTPSCLTFPGNFRYSVQCYARSRQRIMPVTTFQRRDQHGKLRLL